MTVEQRQALAMLLRLALEQIEGEEVLTRSQIEVEVERRVAGAVAEAVAQVRREMLVEVEHRAAAGPHAVAIVRRAAMVDRLALNVGLSRKVVVQADVRVRRTQGESCLERQGG